MQAFGHRFRSEFSYFYKIIRLALLNPAIFCCVKNLAGYALFIHLNGLKGNRNEK
jgi:hypothetical protein